VNYAKALDAGMKPAKLYIKELEREKAKLESLDKKFEQYERKQRRDFLDNDPQGGVSGIPGFQTTDDKAMLAFYICFGVFTFLVITGIVSFFRDQLGNAKAQANIVLVAWAGSMGLAYYGIAVYG
jgi:hypothetical protein